MSTPSAPFDDQGNTLAEHDDTLALGALREYADHDLAEPARTAFKHRLVDDSAFYAVALQGLKQVSDLLYYAASFDQDEAHDLVRMEKAFRATVRTDPPEIRRLREYFLVHHRALLVAEPLTPEERVGYEQRVDTFLASYRERLALLPPA